MILLVLGILLWSAVHLMPVVAPHMRAGLVAKMGEWPYKGVFALLVLGALALIIIGWRSVESSPILYDIRDLVIVPALVLLLVAFTLVAASKLPNNFRLKVRHPMLAGFKVWAFTHLLLNGDLRSVILFGGLLVWSVISMILINKRDGDWVKPARVLPHNNMMVVAVGLVLFIAAVMGHEYLSGINLQVKN